MYLSAHCVMSLDNIFFDDIGHADTLWFVVLSHYCHTLQLLFIIVIVIIIIIIVVAAAAVVHNTCQHFFFF